MKFYAEWLFFMKFFFNLSSLCECKTALQGDYKRWIMNWARKKFVVQCWNYARLRSVVKNLRRRRETRHNNGSAWFAVGAETVLLAWAVRPFLIFVILLEYFFTFLDFLNWLLAHHLIMP